MGHTKKQKDELFSDAFSEVRLKYRRTSKCSNNRILQVRYLKQRGTLCLFIANFFFYTNYKELLVLLWLSFDIYFKQWT